LWPTGKLEVELWEVKHSVSFESWSSRFIEYDEISSFMHHAQRTKSVCRSWCTLNTSSSISCWLVTL